MRSLPHLARTLWAVVRFGVAPGRRWLLVAVVVGLALLAFVAAAQTLAPVALYPLA